jgi:hypothetical protein
MMIDEIIDREIKQLVRENSFDEKNNRMKKLKRGLRTNFDVESDKVHNPDVNSQEANDLISKLDNGYMNIAKIAQKVYPDHTPEGAQSQLRKKIKRLRSDSGSTYKIKSKEARKIRSILNRIE